MRSSTEYLILRKVKLTPLSLMREVKLTKKRVEANERRVRVHDHFIGRPMISYLEKIQRSQETETSKEKKSDIGDQRSQGGLEAEGHGKGFESLWCSRSSERRDKTPGL